jgi:hypothetical protein
VRKLRESLTLAREVGYRDVCSGSPRSRCDETMPRSPLDELLEDVAFRT